MEAIMGRKGVWVLGPALGLVLLTTPATAQISVGVGVAVPGVSANVVYGAPPVYVPPYAAYPVPYPYAVPYYAPPYYYGYPAYGPRYYRGHPVHYHGRAPHYYRGGPRYYNNGYYYNDRVPDYYRGVGAMAYPDPRTTGRTYNNNGRSNVNVRYGRSNGNGRSNGRR
jgi:hypothetical protein